VPGADEVERLVAGDVVPARGQLQVAERVVDGLLEAHLDAAHGVTPADGCLRTLNGAAGINV
jgi:hypothetical protein